MFNCNMAVSLWVDITSKQAITRSLKQRILKGCQSTMTEDVRRSQPKPGLFFIQQSVSSIILPTVSLYCIRSRSKLFIQFLQKKTDTKYFQVVSIYISTKKKKKSLFATIHLGHFYYDLLYDSAQQILKQQHGFTPQVTAKTPECCGLHRFRC